MSSQNILEPIVNYTFETVKLTGKLLLKLLDIKEYFNIEEFFKTVDLKNKKSQYPKQIKIYSSEKGYIYLMSVPIGLSLEDFNKYKGSLEIQLKNKVEIKERKGYIEIEVITKELRSKINYTTPCRIKDSIYIPFAETLGGTVCLDLKETPHTLCTGTTGGGKSVTTKNIITSVINLYPNEVDLYLIDFKIVELSIFKKLKQCKACPKHYECAKKNARKILYIGVNAIQFYKISKYQETSDFKEKYKKRASIEAKNAELKRFHGLNRARGYGLLSVSKQSKLVAIAVNIKRIAAIISSFIRNFSLFIRVSSFKIYFL